MEEEGTSPTPTGLKRAREATDDGDTTGKFHCCLVRCSNEIAVLAGTSKKPKPRPIAAPPNVAAGTVMQQNSTVPSPHLELDCDLLQELLAKAGDDPRFANLKVDLANVLS
jgi:hypothetical protein